MTALISSFSSVPAPSSSRRRDHGRRAGAPKRRIAWTCVLVFISFCVLLVAGAGSRRGSQEGGDGPEDEVDIPFIDDATAADEKSQFLLYVGVLRAEPERIYSNLIISPFSIMSMFRTLEAGAGGETLQQMSSFFDEEREELVSPALEAPAFFRSAQRVYVNSDEGDHRLAAYRGRVAQFGTEVRLFDFPSREGAVAEINAFVNEATEGMIGDILSTEELQYRPDLTAVNAAFLKAPWENAFTGREEGTFYALTSDHRHVEQQVMFMSHLFAGGQIHHVHIEGWGGVIRVPFTDRRLSMYVVVPDDNENLAADLTRLNSRLDSFISAAMSSAWVETDRAVRVKMPQFHISPDSCKINVIRVMEQLGITKLSDEANFSRLSDYAADLSLDIWTHEAGITVDENGATASGASAGSIRSTSGSDQPPLEFFVERPFHFAVVYHPDVREGAGEKYLILFDGHIVDAAAAQAARPQHD